MIDFLGGILFLIIGLAILFMIGYSARWIYFKVIGAPSKLKNGIQKGLDNQIDRTLERNPRTTIVEEHNTYNDIKILNKNDINVNL